MTFYSKVFGSKLDAMMTWGDSPMKDKTAPEHKDRILHSSLALTPHFSLMGNDYLPGIQKHKFQAGNNVEITLELNTKAEADRLFRALAVDSQESDPLQDMWWGSYFGSVTDQFGTKWMFDVSIKEEDTLKCDLQSAALSLRESAKIAADTAAKLEAYEVPPCKKNKMEDKTESVATGP